jgi:hypothetical protein
MISPRSTKKSLKTSNVTEWRRARVIELLPQLTFQTGELTFEFAINEDGAQAMVENLQQFLDMVQSRGSTIN